MTTKSTFSDHLRLWVSLVLAALPVIFIFQNMRAARVQFLFWSIDISLALLIFIVLGIGVIIGWLFVSWLGYRRTSKKSG
jgi:uncharacterized integral membrane protein